MYMYRSRRETSNTAHGYFEAVSLCKLYNRKLVLQNCHSLAAAGCSGSYLFALQERTSCVAGKGMSDSTG